MMLRPWIPAAAALACTPTLPPPPVVTPVASDMSPAPGPEAPVPADSPPADEEKPAAAPPRSDLAPITLPADAGLKLVLDLRVWDVIAAPGRIVGLDPDFLHLSAHDATTGAAQWRVQAQASANGRHTLFGHGDQVVLHAGSDRIHVELATGKLRGTWPTFTNGDDRGCVLGLFAGDQHPDYSAWIPATHTSSACAAICECSLRLFDCSGATDGGASFHSQETHLYRKMGEPHDTVCFKQPSLMARGAARIVVRVEDDEHKQTIAGLDPQTFARKWSRRDLADDNARYGSAGVDPSGQTCWLADDRALTVFVCATGVQRWRMTLGGDADDAGHAEIQWTGSGLFVQHRDDRRTLVELRDAAGKPRWRRTLAASRHALLPAEPLAYLYHGGAAIEAHTLLEPTTGKTLGEIPATKNSRLLRAGDDLVRIGDGVLAEFDARGGKLRETTLADSDSVVRVTESHVVVAPSDEVRVLKRGTLAPVLTLPGRWALHASEAALGPDALLLVEHRGEDTHRALLLR